MSCASDVVLKFFIKPDCTHNGGVSGFQENDPDTAKALRRDEEPQWPDEDQRDQVQRWIEVCQPIAGGGFEYIHTIDVKVLFSCMRSDFCEAVAQDTDYGGDQKDVGKANKD